MVCVSVFCVCVCVGLHTGQLASSKPDHRLTMDVCPCCEEEGKVPQISTSKAQEPSVEIKAQRVSKPLRWPTTHRCPHTTAFVCACVSGRRSTVLMIMWTNDYEM